MRNAGATSAFLEHHWLWLAAIAAITVVTFGAVLWADFVLWDDTLLITSNPVIRGFTFQNIIRAFSVYDPELYIPLAFLTYQIEYSIAALQPWIYHLTNLLLHAGNACLVGVLLFTITRNRTVALLSGLLFAIHPLQTEAVAWASSRKDLLATLFFLLSLLSYLQYREDDSKKTYYKSLFFFALSLLSKVVSVTLPLLLLLLDWLERRPWSRKQIVEKIPFFFLSFAFGVIALFGKRMTAELVTPLDLLLVAGKSTLFYLQKMLLPFDLTIVYPLEGNIAASRPDLFVPWMIIVFLFAVSLFFVKKTRVPLFAAVWYLLTLAPTFTNIAKGHEIYFASDRYAYIPFIGILLLLAVFLDWIVRRWPSMSSTLTTLCTVWVIFLAFFSMQQAKTWRDSLALLEHAIEVSPKSFAAHINLSVAYRQIGQTDAAVRILNAAKEIQDNHEIYKGLAAVKYRNNDFQGALADLRKADETKKDRADADIPYGFGLVYMKMNDFGKAAEAYRDALDIEPKHSGARNNLAAVLLQEGKLSEARKEYEQILKDDPTFAIGHYNYGLILEQQNEIPGAIEAYKTSIHFGGRQFDVLSHLGPLLVQNGQVNEGLSTLEEAIHMNPTDTAFIQQVLSLVQTVLEKDPTNAKARSLVQWMIERGLVKSQ